MINLKELRPGNLVKYTGKPYPSYPLVDGIVEVEEVLRDGVNRSQGDSTLYESENLEGIPLTPEWLDKFGAEKHGDWYQIMKLGGAHCLNYSIKHSAYSISKDGYDNEEVGFKGNLFVHQLQNIYYWLSMGEELTIKETV